MEITNIEYKQDQAGYPFMSLNLDGKKARIFYDQNYRKYGLIFLGVAFEDVVPRLRIEPDPANGRPKPELVRGFTDDPKIIQLYDNLKAECDADKFSPRFIASKI